MQNYYKELESLLGPAGQGHKCIASPGVLQFWKLHVPRMTIHADWLANDAMPNFTLSKSWTFIYSVPEDIKLFNSSASASCKCWLPWYWHVLAPTTPHLAPKP